MKSNQLLPHSAKGRWMFAIIMLLFFGPMLLSYILYQYALPLFSQHTVNHGFLLQPPLDFKQLQIKQLSQPVVPYAGKWWIVFVPSLPCHQACESALYKMRQVRLALGKDQQRVQRLTLIFDNTEKKSRRELALLLNGTYQGTYLGSVDRSRFHTIVASRLAKQVDTQAGAFYIVDPHGNLMLAYAASVQPRDMYNDLIRLLKVSHIG